jgi:hypothetical protein
MKKPSNPAMKVGLDYRYRPRNTRYEEKYTQQCNSSGRFSVTVWGWTSAYGPGVLCI